MSKRLDHTEIRATFERTKAWRPSGNLAEVARVHGIAQLTARRICQPSSAPGAGARNRMRAEPIGDRGARLPSIDSPFLETRRTRYPSSVVSADDVKGWALKSGANHAKIGARIAKGEWSGMPVYTLTLEERATCPTSCRHWRSCYGNSMNWAQRIETGPALERRLWREVRELGDRHPAGFVVRLHVLGDFYSPFYVALWALLLDEVPALRVFGYTARWQREDPIARPLIELARTRWDRFAMRFSNAPIETCSTVSIEHPIQAPAGAIICPQQRGATATCSTCALCWSTNKPIAFLQH